jgi:hypothetical protein
MPNVQEIRALSACCDQNPISGELWVEPQWPRWRRALRQVGKRACVAAALEALRGLGPTAAYDTYVGTGNLPYAVNEHLWTELIGGLAEWLRSDDKKSRMRLSAVVGAYESALDAERAKGWFVVTSRRQPVAMLVSVGRAVVAKGAFDRYIREALVESWSWDKQTASRFREALLRLLA